MPNLQYFQKGDKDYLFLNFTKMCLDITIFLIHSERPLTDLGNLLKIKYKNEKVSKLGNILIKKTDKKSLKIPTEIFDQKCGHFT